MFSVGAMNTWGKRPSLSVPDPLIVGEVQTKRLKLGAAPTNYELPLANGPNGYVLTAQTSGPAVWAAGGAAVIPNPLVVADLNVTTSATIGNFPTNYGLPISATAGDSGKVLTCQGFGTPAAWLPIPPIADPLLIGEVDASVKLKTLDLEVTGTGTVTTLNVTSYLEVLAPGSLQFFNAYGGLVDINNLITDEAKIGITPTSYTLPLSATDADTGKALICQGHDAVAAWVANPPAGPMASIESATNPLTQRADCLVAEVRIQGDLTTVKNNAVLQTPTVTWDLPVDLQFAMKFTANVTIFPVTVTFTGSGSTDLTVDFITETIQAALQARYDNLSNNGQIITVSSDFVLLLTVTKFIFSVGTGAGTGVGFLQTLTLKSSSVYPDNELIGADLVDLNMAPGIVYLSSTYWLVQPISINSSSLLTVSPADVTASTLVLGGSAAGSGYRMPTERPSRYGAAGALANYTIMLPPVVNEPWYYLAYANVPTYSVAGVIRPTVGVNIPWVYALSPGSYSVQSVLNGANAAMRSTIAQTSGFIDPASLLFHLVGNTVLFSYFGATGLNQIQLTFGTEGTTQDGNMARFLGWTATFISDATGGSDNNLAPNAQVLPFTRPAIDDQPFWGQGVPRDPTAAEIPTHPGDVIQDELTTTRLSCQVAGTIEGWLPTNLVTPVFQLGSAPAPSYLGNGTLLANTALVSNQDSIALFKDSTPRVHVTDTNSVVVYDGAGFQRVIVNNTGGTQIASERGVGTDYMNIDASSIYMAYNTQPVFYVLGTSTRLWSPSTSTVLRLEDGLGVNINGAYYLPTVDGTAGQAITTDGAGTSSWSTILGAVINFGGNLNIAGRCLLYSGIRSGPTPVGPDSVGNPFITPVPAATVTSVSWDSDTADVSTVMRIYKNAVPAATFNLTGVRGTKTGLSVPSVLGDRLAVEFVVGTAPGNMTLSMYFI